MFGIGVGAFALVVILSVFNGLEDLIIKLYSNFDSDLRIEAAYGKTFAWDDFPGVAVVTHNQVANLTRSVEETVMFKYKDNQVFATLKGVDSTFHAMTGIDTMIWVGSSTLKADDGRNFILPGYLVSDQMGLRLHDITDPVRVYAPKRTKGFAIRAESAFRVEPIFPSGIFSINAEFDSKYVLANYDWAAELLGLKGYVSAVELDLKPGADPVQVQAELSEILGPVYRIETRQQRNDIIYQTSQSEKWFTFLILAFILLIATFNLIGSLTMLILDKQHDIQILKSMGANKGKIVRIFHLEGQMIAWIGGFSGIVLGLIICWIQVQFEVVKIQGLLVDSYPILVKWEDVLTIAVTVLLIGYVAAWLPARLIGKLQYYSKT